MTATTASEKLLKLIVNITITVPLAVILADDHRQCCQSKEVRAGKNRVTNASIIANTATTTSNIGATTSIY
jgi:hypothetical protein